LNMRRNWTVKVKDLVNVDYESEAEDDMLPISRKGEGNHLLPLFDCFSLVYFAAEVFQMFVGSSGYKEVESLYLVKISLDLSLGTSFKLSSIPVTVQSVYPI
ncbi:hypothetical protein D5086_005723, partial [Populus alba]